MKSWQEDTIQALHALQSEDEVFARICAMARDIGFDHLSFGLRTPLPISAPRTILRTNYSEGWLNRYVSEGYLTIDPTVAHGMRSIAPLVWSDEAFASARHMWEDAQAYGLKVGWAQSTRDAQGLMGLLSLSRSGEPLGRNELRALEERMVWLAQVAHQAMAPFMSQSLLPERDIKLSPREIDVLRWTAEGKTSGEISDILGISERTVNFHINNLMTKMNVTNKTAAAIRAAVLGLLY